MAMEPQQRSELGCELVAYVARSFGEVRLKVMGASMIPSIWPGDIVIVRRHDMAALRPGHVVVYKREGVLVTHRISNIRGDLLIMRGDSTRHDDPPIQKPEIVGQVISLVRNGHSVHLNQSSWQRAGSSIVRRSDFWLRMALRLHNRLRRMAWTS